MRSQKEIKSMISRLLREPVTPPYKGFAEACRHLEVEVLMWVLGRKERLPFEPEPRAGD